MTTALLKYPAPRRCSHISQTSHAPGEETKNRYTTRPWQLTDILFAISAGAWFTSSHDFAPGASEFAQNAQIIYNDLIGGENA